MTRGIYWRLVGDEDDEGCTGGGGQKSIYSWIYTTQKAQRHKRTLRRPRIQDGRLDTNRRGGQKEEEEETGNIARKYNIFIGGTQSQRRRRSGGNWTTTQFIWTNTLHGGTTGTVGGFSAAQVAL